MNPENFYITTFTISLDEFRDIFPWFEDLGIEEEKVIEKPKSKAGRKPKAHRVTDNSVEMKIND